MMPRPVTSKITGGYIGGGISVDETHFKYLVHRVIWIATNGPIPDGANIKHINGDKSDNRISNLRTKPASHSPAAIPAPARY